MVVRKRRRKKTGIRKWENTLIISIVVVYMIFSGFVFWDMGQLHVGVINDRPSTRISSVWLDSVPYHQPFKASKTVGIRIYLCNPYSASEGVVSVKIGNQQTGKVLYTSEILVTEISDSKLEDYIEIIPENMAFEDDVIYYVELDAISCAEKTIKTYFGAMDTYGVSHAGDTNDLSNKMMCIAVIQEVIPFIFIIWIFISSLIVMMIIFVFSKKSREIRHEEIALPTSTESKLIIPVLILIGLFGTGALSLNKITTKSVDIKDEVLADGYELEEHSSYNQQFIVKRNDLKEIHISLERFFENVGTFVISIQKGQDEIVQSVQSKELDKIDGSYYIWDVSELGLKKGEIYDLYIYTGFIGEDEENPVIKRIEYFYSK